LFLIPSPGGGASKGRVPLLRRAVATTPLSARPSPFAAHHKNANVVCFAFLAISYDYSASLRESMAGVIMRHQTKRNRAFVAVSGRR
jgi:hypothetical protein